MLQSALIALSLVIAPAALASEEVEVYGPDEVALETYTIRNQTGRALKVNVDRRTIRACYSGIRYSVDKLQSGDILVRSEQGPVPAVMCMPHMLRAIELGVTVELPAGEDGLPSYTRLLVPAGAKVEVVRD